MTRHCLGQRCVDLLALMNTYICRKKELALKVFFLEHINDEKYK